MEGVIGPVIADMAAVTSSLAKEKRATGSQTLRDFGSLGSVCIRIELQSFQGRDIFSGKGFLENLGVIARFGIGIAGAACREALSRCRFGSVLDGVTRQHCPLEGRDCLSGVVAVGQRTEHPLECRNVLRVISQSLDRSFPGMAVTVKHLQRISHGALGLFFQ